MGDTTNFYGFNDVVSFQSFYQATMQKKQYYPTFGRYNGIMSHTFSDPKYVRFKCVDINTGNDYNFTVKGMIYKRKKYI